MKKRGVVVRLAVVMLTAAYLIYMPGYVMEQVQDSSTYRERLLKTENERYTGVITVWHIVGFKPYIGSLSTWLGDVAKRVEKAHFGVFTEITGMTNEEYEQRVLRGERADVYSFPMGWGYAEQFLEMSVVGGASFAESVPFKGSLAACGTYGENGLGKPNLYAPPYAMSGYMLMVSTRYAQELGLEIPDGRATAETLGIIEQGLRAWENTKKPASAFSVHGNAAVAVRLGVRQAMRDKEDFTAERTVALFCDVRAAGGMDRAYLSGKGVPTNAYAASGWTDLVQLMGVSRNIARDKLPYVAEFMQRLLQPEWQQTLSHIGLFPVCRFEGTQPIYGRDELQSLYELLDTPQTPNAFAYSRYSAALNGAADEVLLAREHALKAFEERMKEVEYPLEINAEIQ